MKESQFLAPILLESPLMFEILEKIRDTYSVDRLHPTKDPRKQCIGSSPTLPSPNAF